MLTHRPLRPAIEVGVELDAGGDEIGTQVTRVRAEGEDRAVPAD